MKLRIFIFTVLASVGFFNPHQMFSPQVQKLMFYLAIGVGLMYAIKSGVSLRDTKYPKKELIVLLAGMVVSTFMASAFHSQSLKVSLMTTLPYILAYSFFFIMMKLDIPRHKIIISYLILCIAATFVYFANVATMPLNIFGESILGEDITRGIIRIPVVFIEMFPLIVFYSICQWHETKKRRWLLVLAWASLMIVLSVVRQIILLTAVLGLLYFFRQIDWKKKLLGVAAVVAIIIWVLPLIPIYNTMMELSEEQKEENEEVENIRITAWRYYTYDNQTNAITPIFGNGVPSIGNSVWGKMFESETQDNGCFDTDVGWAGFYWYFGIFSTAALVIIFIKAISKKKPPELKYLNYWFIFLMITCVASGIILYYRQIISITVCLYLVFKKTDDTTAHTSMAPDTTKTLKDSPSTLFKKLPQLRK